MNLDKLKKSISNDKKRVEAILNNKKYYSIDNDILEKGVLPIDGGDPLRDADNRIPHNFHQILVDEKASYLFTYPVLFDVENDTALNEKINFQLGDEFSRKSKNLCIEASNVGTAWLHYWINDETKEFKYALVNTEQVIPFYDNTLERNLSSIIRYYTTLESVEGEDDEKTFCYIEYWTNETFQKFKLEGSFGGEEVLSERIEVNHTLLKVPFIEFANNSIKKSDLDKYKKLIDSIDKVTSGFMNDLDDIQQVIYILEDYGGENLREFKEDLKRFKAVKTESENGGGGVKTLQIEIPVEARKVILELVKKQIYESGQGLQQDVESVGSASGVALKFFYRKLELKSGLLETEFRTSYNKLIRAILRFLKEDEKKKITQTWVRNMISNDLENAQIAKDSKGVIPDKIIWRNHPWVDNPDEIQEMFDEQKKSMFVDDYKTNPNEVV